MRSICQEQDQHFHGYVLDQAFHFRWLDPWTILLFTIPMRAPQRLANQANIICATVLEEALLSRESPLLTAVDESWCIPYVRAPPFWHEFIDCSFTWTTLVRSCDL